MIAIDFSKPQALDSDPNAIQQHSFTRNLERDNGAIIFFIIKELSKYCECVPHFYYVLI